MSRIESLDPKLGAFITVNGDQAMDAARAAERDIMRGKHRGPLHGIPFAVKDTYYTAGVRTTAGSAVFETTSPRSMPQSSNMQIQVRDGVTSAHRASQRRSGSNPEDGLFSLGLLAAWLLGGEEQHGLGGL